jgi:hypothetical protein
MVCSGEAGGGVGFEGDGDEVSDDVAGVDGGDAAAAAEPIVSLQGSINRRTSPSILLNSVSYNPLTKRNSAPSSVSYTGSTTSSATPSSASAEAVEPSRTLLLSIWTACDAVYAMTVGAEETFAGEVKGDSVMRFADDDGDG